ncbi:methyl-accepting chemotaxis protein [Novosphingobium sp.]|uniref:methyl-accepting chemotaxis protein n=1 Tax=Novosphingobium sp. TaxID=1874826 RepID=UPI0038B6E668
MLERYSLPRKLGFSFMAVTLSAAAMMLVFGYNIIEISASTANNDFSQSIHSDALELETALLRQNSQMRGYLVTNDESYLKSYYEGRDAYDKTSAKLEGKLTDPALKDLVVKSREETLNWRRDWGDKAIAMVKQGQRDAALTTVRDAGKAVLVTDAVLPLRKLRDAEKAQMARFSGNQAQAILIAWITLVLGGAGLITLSVRLARILSRLIATPVVDLTRIMSQLAAGNNDVTIPDVERTDELGDMARAVEVFRDAARARVVAVQDRERAMAEIGEGLHAIAQADLSVRLHDLPDAFVGVAEDYNVALERLCTAMNSVQGSITAINNTSVEIRQATLDLSKRSEHQAANLQSSANAMSDMTTKVVEYAEIASGANRSMDEAREEAEKGGAVVSRAIAAMQGVDQASSEIADIVSLIDGIAFQTNLLALNAGVEAARAGESGKGFAVVANEVRALAQRAADAARDIRTRVDAVTTHVRSGAGLVNDTGVALQRIIERVTKVGDAVASIAETASQQSIGLGQVNSSIGEMDRMTQQNTAMVEETTAATQSLAREVEQLAKAFSSFRISQGQGQGHASHQSQASYAPQPAAPIRPASRPAPMAASAPAPLTASAPARTAAPQRVASGGQAAAAHDDWSEF